MLRAVVALCVACAALANCGPDLGGLERGEDARISAVLSADRVELDNGMEVFLAEIDAPERGAQFYDESIAELEALASGRKARLAYGGQKRLAPRESADDQASAERAIAHIYVQTEGGRWFWLQEEMVARGAAFVRPRRANHARAPELIAIEAQAREARLGLWDEQAYGVLSTAEAAALAQDFDQTCTRGDAPYRLVAARVGDARVSRSRAELVITPPRENDETALDPDAPAPFSIVVFGAAFADWDGAPLFAFNGERVRARGRLGVYRGGAQICLERAEEIEIIAPSDD